MTQQNSETSTVHPVAAPSRMLINIVAHLAEDHFQAAVALMEEDMRERRHQIAGLVYHQYRLQQSGESDQLVEQELSEHLRQYDEVVQAHLDFTEARA